MSLLRACLVVAILSLAALAPAAQAGPDEDFNAVFADWKPDGDVTSCRFTRPQLVNARNVAGGVTDFNTYNPGFSDEVTREIRRHDEGGCPTTPPGGDPYVSPLAEVRLGKIRPRKGLRESIVIVNRGSARVSLGRATLRDRSGNRVKLRGRLGAGRSLRVFTGCARGAREPVRRGARLFACRKKRVWNDRGDVVKLFDARGVPVTQRGYGTRRGAPRF